jgi:hypothetical protein
MIALCRRSSSRRADATSKHFRDIASCHCGRVLLIPMLRSGRLPVRAEVNRRRCGDGWLCSDERDLFVTEGCDELKLFA